MNLPSGFRVLWRAAVESPSAEPGASLGGLWIQPEGSTLHAFDLTTGARKWSTDGLYRLMTGDAHAVVVAVVTGRATRILRGLSLETGKVLWERVMGGELHRHATRNPEMSRVLRAGEIPVLALTRGAGAPTLYRVEPRTGATNPLCEIPRSLWPLAGSGAVFSSASREPEVVWFDGVERHVLTVDRMVEILHAYNGRIATFYDDERPWWAIWDLATKQKIYSYEGDPCAPGLDADRLYLQRDGHAEAIDRVTGEVFWQGPRVPGWHHALQPVGRYVAWGSRNEARYLDAQTGEVAWDARPGIPSVLADGLLVWGFSKGLIAGRWDG